MIGNKNMLYYDREGLPQFAMARGHNFLEVTEWIIGSRRPPQFIVAKCHNFSEVAIANYFMIIIFTRVLPLYNCVIS